MPIRLKILLGCLLMTAVSVVLGLFALRAEQRLGDLAISTYDEAFMSMNFVRSAETKFETMRGAYAASGETAAAFDKDIADQGFAGVLEDLDVAIGRATTEPARQRAMALRTTIADIAGQAGDVAGTSTRLVAAAPVFEDVVEMFAEDGFKYRTRAGAVVAQSVRSTWIAIAASVLAAIVITLLLSAMIVPALRRAARVALAIADGELGNVIPTRARRSRSETVILFGALDRMQTAIRTDLARIEAMRAAELATRANADAARRAALSEMADTVEREAASAITRVASTTAQMEGTAHTVALSVRRTTCSVEEATAAAGRALATAQTVAGAADQLAASINTITQEVGELARGSRRAVMVAKDVRDVIETLVVQAKRIGDVAGLIGSIAARTNLLALNATIEAARAGEAGRGFAVVAGEVKSLAAQTARATRDISGELNAIMAATDRAMQAVELIDRETGQVDALGNSIAAAVQQQSAATAEIARSVAETSSSVKLVSGRIAALTDEASATGRFMETVCGDGAALNEAVGALTSVVIEVVRSSAQRA